MIRLVFDENVISITCRRGTLIITSIKVKSIHLIIHIFYTALFVPIVPEKRVNFDWHALNAIIHKKVEGDHSTKIFCPVL